MACPIPIPDREAQSLTPPRPWLPFRLSYDRTAIGYTTRARERRGVWSLEWWRLGRGVHCHGSAVSPSLLWVLRIGVYAWWKVRS